MTRRWNGISKESIMVSPMSLASTKLSYRARYLGEQSDNFQEIFLHNCHLTSKRSVIQIFNPITLYLRESTFSGRYPQDCGFRLDFEVLSMHDFCFILLQSDNKHKQHTTPATLYMMRLPRFSGESGRPQTWFNSTQKTINDCPGESTKPLSVGNSALVKTFPPTYLDLEMPTWL